MFSGSDHVQMPRTSVTITDSARDDAMVSRIDKKVSTDPSEETLPEENFKINGGTWLPSLLGGLMLAAAFIPYFIAVSKGVINPLLPFISDAAGSPPQSGIFSILLSLSAGIGFISLVTRYLMVRILNRPYRKRVDYMNKISVLFALGSLGGMIIVGGYPVNFEREKPTWLLQVLLPHMIGAVMLFGSGVAFGFIQCGITYYVMPQQRGLLALRVLFLTLCGVSQLCVVATFRHAINVDIFNTTVLQYIMDHKALEIQQGLSPVEPPPWELPKDYNNYYLICSISEWLMTVFFIAFFFTFIPEAKKFCSRISVTQIKPIMSSSTQSLNKFTSSSTNGGSLHE